MYIFIMHKINAIATNSCLPFLSDTPLDSVEKLILWLLLVLLYRNTPL